MSFLDNQERQFEKETNIAILRSIQDNVENNLDQLHMISQLFSSPTLNILRSILNIGDSINKSYKNSLNVHHILIDSIYKEKEKLNLDSLDTSLTTPNISDLGNNLNQANSNFEKLFRFFNSYNFKIGQLVENSRNFFSKETLDFLTNLETDSNDDNKNPEVMQATNNIQTNASNDFCIIPGDPKIPSRSRTESIHSENPIYEDINSSNIISKKRIRESAVKSHEDKKTKENFKIILQLKDIFPDHSSKISDCFINTLKKVTKLKTYILRGNNISFTTGRSMRFSKIKMTFDVGDLNEAKLNEINLLLKPHFNNFAFIFDRNKQQVVTGGILSKRFKREELFNLIEKEILVEKFEAKGVLFEIYYHLSELIFSMKNLITSSSDNPTDDINELNLLQLLKQFQEENEINKNILSKYLELKQKIKK
jgi:hypothetical protein